MSREPLKLYLPCTIFSVRVILGPSRNLTKLEQLVLRAVSGGADTLGGLERLFAIGSRPMLRLVLGMLDSGYLAIDLETGILRVGQEVVEAVAENRLDQLSSTDTRAESLTLMYDLVAGTVFRCRSRARNVRSGYTLSPRLPMSSFRKIDKARLLRVADEIVRKWKTRADRELKVLELGLDLQQAPSDASSGEHRVIETEVRVQRDEVSGYLKITVLYPDDLGSLARRRLEEELTRLVNLPEPPLALKNLRDRPELVRLEGSLDLKRGVDDLHALLSRLANADQGTFDEWQSSLADHAAELETALSEHRSCRLEHVVVSDQQEQVDLINTVIRRCGRQLVLACPFLRYDPMMQYRDAIEQAVDRGVRVFLLWGLGSATQGPEPDPGGLTNWFDGLKERYPDRFYWCLREANVHAKFVIGDASELFVTSYNYLNKHPDTVFELGMWIGTPGTSERNRRSQDDLQMTCFPALNALRIAREKFPADDDRQRMLIDAVDYGGWEPGAADGSGGWPTRSSAERTDNATRLQMDRLWRKKWQDYAERLSATLLGLGTTFEIVRDARHRELLYDALRTAHHRVVVLSDRLSSAVVNRRFMDELKACLQRDVRVVLLCHQPEASPLRELRELEGACGDSLQVLVAQGSGASGEISGKNHAKVLIADDAAVVTSFNFLSFAADDFGPDRHRLSTELGLALRGGRAADQVLEAIRHRWPAISLVDKGPVEGVEPQVPVAVAPADSPIARDVERLLEEIAATVQKAAYTPGNQVKARAKSLSEWFDGAPSGEVALLELADLHVAAPPFMDQAIACFLAVWIDRIPPESATAWIRKLIELLWWEKEDAMGVLVLLSLLGGNGLSLAIPPPEIAELTAQYDLLGAASTRFVDVALEIEEARNSAMRQAAAALAIPQVIYLDDGPIEALELLTQSLQDGLAGWAQAAVRFREVHPATGQSREQLQAIVDFEAMRTRCGELHKALCLHLEKACALNLDFMVFKLTWPHLRRGEMGLDRLLEAARKKDVDHVAAFVAKCRERYGKGPGVADRMLDTAVAEGATRIAQQYRHIQGKFRGKCLDHLNDVLQLTREWVQATRAVERNAAVSDPEALKALALSIMKHKSAVEELYRTVAESRSFEGPLLGRMIRELEPIWQLGVSYK